MFQTHISKIEGSALTKAQIVVEAALRETEKATRQADHLRNVVRDQQQEIKARDDILQYESKILHDLQATVASLEQELHAWSGLVQEVRLGSAGALHLSIPLSSCNSAPCGMPPWPPTPPQPMTASSNVQAPQQAQLPKEHAELLSSARQRLEVLTEIGSLRRRVAELELLYASSLADAEALRQEAAEVQVLRRDAIELKHLRQQVAELEPLRNKVSELESLQKQRDELEVLRDQLSELERLRSQVAQLDPLRKQLEDAQHKAMKADGEQKTVRVDNKILRRKYDALMMQKLKVEEDYNLLCDCQVDMACIRSMMPAVDAAMADLEERLCNAEAILASNRADAEAAAHSHQEQRRRWRSKMEDLQAQLAHRPSQLVQVKLELVAAP